MAFEFTRTMRLTAKLLLSAVLASSAVRQVYGHAYLEYPMSRNYQAYVLPPPESKYYCPHCGQGGGTGHTPGMCGDPFQDVVGNPSFVPFASRFYAATTLSQGQILNIKIHVSTNHGGRMHLSVCPLAKEAVTQDCFNLPQHRLRRVNADPKYNNKVYWYLNLTASQSGYTEEKFRLPADVNCENGCMLQWYWYGCQSCTLPCEDTNTDDVPGECGYNPINPLVSRCTNLLQTEQFANCADIIIKKGTPAPVPSPMPPQPTPSPARSPSPAPRSPSPAPSPTPSPSPSPVVRSPSPKPSPAPLPSPGPTSCPSGDWRCSSCKTAAAANSLAASSLVSTCFQCSTAVTDPSGCSSCLTASKNIDIIRGCLGCAAAGLPGWACTQFCAQLAGSGQQMTACQACLATPGINTWGCQNCLQMSGGDSSKSDQCLSCVKAGRDGWTCGQCAAKGTPQAVAACYQCLAMKPRANWGSCL